MGLFLTCLSIALAYFSPPELLPSLAPYHIQMFLILAAVVVTVPTLANRPDRTLQSPQYLLMLGLWAAIVASHVSKLKIRWGFEGFVSFAFVVSIYFLITMNAFTLRRIKAVAGVVVACGVLLGMQAILAYHTGYLGDKLVFRAAEPGSVMGDRVRGLGFLEDPNDFAQFLLVCLALLGCFWKKSRGALNYFYLGPTAVILLYTSYLTFSRGGFLGLGAVLFFAIYRKHRRFVSFTLGGVGMLLLYLLHFTGNREITIENGRLMAWGAGIGGIVQHPIFGVGFRRFEELNDLTAHNSFVLCFAELGLVGYFFWMALLLTTVAGLSFLAGLEVKTDEDAEFAGVVYAIRAALFSFIVTGWFLSRTYNESLYILLALAVGVIHLRAYLIPAEKFRFGPLIPRTIALEFVSIAIAYLTIKARAL